MLHSLKYFAVLLVSQVALWGHEHETGGTNPQPWSIYENNAPVTFGEISPQIDANVFINRSFFEVGVSSILDAIPFDTQNTFAFTNAGSGIMLGYPGFRFDLVDPSTNAPARRPTDWFVNFNQVVGQYSLHVYSTNILSPGELAVGPGGSMIINGQNVNLNRGSLRSGNHPDYIGIGFDTTITFGNLVNYENPPGVRDLYWGTGFNNVLEGDERRLRLPQFLLPNPSTPSHHVLTPHNNTPLNRSLPFTFSFFDPFGTNGRYGAWAITNFVNPTSLVVQVVFAPTNQIGAGTELDVDVRFSDLLSDFTTGDPNFLGRSAAVHLRATSIDPILEVPITNSFVFIDDSAFDATISLIEELGQAGRRPNSYIYALNYPYEIFTNSFNVLPNAQYSPSLLYTNDPAWRFRTNEVELRYVAYAMELGYGPSNSFNQLIFDRRPYPDPTNMPGRISINAANLDMEQARVRAETFLSLRATNDLAFNSLPLIDAPYLRLDVASQSPSLILSNVAPPSVNRLHGRFAAYTAIWTNTITNITFAAGTTNAVDTNVITARFHVLFVDHDLQATQAVVTTELLLRNNNVILDDSFNISRNFRVDADSLTIRPGASLSLPLNSSLAISNFHSGATTTEVRKLVFGNRYETNFVVTYQAPLAFTNLGQLIIPEIGSISGGNFTTTNGILNHFVNDGQLIGASLYVAASNLSVRGAINPSTLNAFNGTMALVGQNVVISNAFLNSSGDVDITASSLAMAQTVINAGTSNTLGRLSFNVSDTLSVTGSNAWVTTGGFQTLRKPATGDFLNSRFQSQAGRRDVTFHVWAGQDRGRTTAGFTNNLAIGHLILNGEPLSLFNFAGLSGQTNALYVDYLEFQNNAATSVETSLRVNSNLKIYFANSSLPAEKLEADFPGRLIWVPEFLGPNSTTNIVYPNGQTYTFNTALAQSCDRDDDNDLVANCQDCTPFPVSGLDTTQPCVTEPGLIQIQLSSTKSSVTIEWKGVPNKDNIVEHRDTSSGGNWQLLTNIFVGASSQKITVVDPLSTNGSRLYRVKTQPK